MSADVEALLEYFRGRPLKTWHVVLMADIIGEKLAEKGLALPPLPPVPPVPPAPPKPEVVKVEVPKPLELPKPQTQFIDRSGVRISGAYELLNLTGRGALKELAIISPSRNFSIQVFSDDMTRIFRSFDELRQISQHVESIAAYEEDGFYVLSVRDISWIDNFRFLIIAHEPIEFKRIFVSYCVYKL
jgi:hypothetical protein